LILNLNLPSWHEKTLYQTEFNKYLVDLFLSTSFPDCTENSSSKTWQALWLDCEGCNVTETVRSNVADIEDLVYTVGNLPVSTNLLPLYSVQLDEFIWNG
jgi:hypothetical protein